MPEPFSLDLASNPHPRMLTEALRLRQKARATNGWPSVTATATRAEWSGYLAAMSDATGEPPAAIEAWMDRAVLRLGVRDLLDDAYNQIVTDEMIDGYASTLPESFRTPPDVAGRIIRATRTP